MICETCTASQVCAECDAELRYYATDPRTIAHARAQGSSAAMWIEKSDGWYALGGHDRPYSDQVDKWAYEADVSAAHWGGLVLRAKEYVGVETE